VSVGCYGQRLRVLACGGLCTLHVRGGTWWSGSPGAATFPWAINSQFRTGTEAGWMSPFGPLRVELGFPITKKSGDDTSVLGFSIGEQP